VPQQVFGKSWRPGGVVVDRDGGDTTGPGAIPYGSRHLWREVQDLANECPEVAEVTAVVGPVALTAPLLTSREEPAQHLGIRRLQEIFRANVDRLDHWAAARRIPAKHHLAERDRRPTVIARTVSFGSQSDAGAHTRGVLMSVRPTLKKRGRDVVAHLNGVLDQRADDLHPDPWPLLFPEGPT
jgi:hypothetical protein